MRILSLTYEDKTTGWKLDTIDLRSPATRHLALLVGMSGVGKTQILGALDYLFSFAVPNSDPGPMTPVSWELRFEEAGVEYTWSGDMEGERDPYLDFPWFQMGPLRAQVYATIPRPRFVYEQVVRHSVTGDETLCERRGGRVWVSGKRNEIEFSEHETLFSILKNHAPIKDFVAGLRSGAFSHASWSFPPTINATEERRDADDRSVKESPHPFVRLSYLEKHDRETFDRICEDFEEIFPKVQRIFFKDVPTPRSLGVQFFYKALYIEEEGLEYEVGPNHWSQGMLKTLVALIEAHAPRPGSPVMIDEFENSLGLNCIDPVVDAITSSSTEHDTQFILTSHHPYIISNIPIDHWRVVVRKGNAVSCLTAQEAGVDPDSFQDPYLKLMNSKVYKAARGVA